MIRGDLVKYRRMNRFGEVSPAIGIILCEEKHAVDHSFFKIVLQTGEIKLVSDHYLDRV